MAPRVCTRPLFVAVLCVGIWRASIAAAASAPSVRRPERRVQGDVKAAAWELDEAATSGGTRQLRKMPTPPPPMCKFVIKPKPGSTATRLAAAEMTVIDNFSNKVQVEVTMSSQVAGHGPDLGVDGDGRTWMALASGDAAPRFTGVYECPQRSPDGFVLSLMLRKDCCQNLWQGGIMMSYASNGTMVREKKLKSIQPKYKLQLGKKLPVATPLGEGCYKSVKRGIALKLNITTQEDMLTLRDGVSWFNNWSLFTNETAPGMTFFPMAWGERGTYWLKNATQVDKNAILLGFNEPNNWAITPETAAQWWGKMLKAKDKYQLPLASPSATGPTLPVPWQPGPAPSTTGSTPPDGVNRTLDSMLGIDWIRSFDAECVRLYGTSGIDYINIHAYTCNVAVLQYTINAYTRALPGRKVIISELACGLAMRYGNDEQQLNWMKQIIPFLEQNDKVAYYSWYNGYRPEAGKPLAPGQPSLLGAAPGELTRLGKEYLKPAYCAPSQGQSA